MMKHALTLLFIAAGTLTNAQLVCYSNGWYSDYGSWNVMQMSNALPSTNPYWQTWAKIDCPVHVYEISQRDKTAMPDCYLLISRAIEPPKLPVVPKLVSYWKKYNGA